MKQYRTVDEYKKMFESIYSVSGMVLFEFANYELEEHKNIILKNFLAKAVKIGESIFILSEKDNYHECQMLYRALIDRYFHILHLDDTNSYNDFYKWSFIKQWEHLNKANSYKDLNNPLHNKKELKKHKEEYEKYKKENIIWHRPDNEKIAKKFKVKMLYDFGYDYASSHIHPMANDGERDYFSITKLEPRPPFCDCSVILNNTLFTLLLMFEQCLNSSSFIWRKILYDYLEYGIENLKSDCADFGISYVKIANMFGEETPLSKKGE